MEDEKFSYRDMTRQFLHRLSHGNYEESERADNLLTEGKKKSDSESVEEGDYYSIKNPHDIKAREDAWGGGENLFSNIDYSKAGGAGAVTKELEIMSITELKKEIAREMNSLFEMREPSEQGAEEWPGMIEDIYHRLRERDAGSGQHDMGEGEYAGEVIDVLMNDVYSEGDSTHATFMLYVDDMRSAGVPDSRTIMRWLGHRPAGSAYDDLEHAHKAIAFMADPYDDPEDAELGPEDLPTEETPRYGEELGADMSEEEYYRTLRQQWQEETF
jgi:hypothetical protein